MERLFCQKIRVVYASRTDRGVHAKGQCVNFKVDTKIPIKNIKAALNSFLPSDITIKGIRRVPLDFHARFSAKSKLYRYIISNKKEPSVFERNYSWYVSDDINLTRMQKAITHIVGKRDFSCFAKQAHRYKQCTRHIMKVTVKKRSRYIYIDVEGDGFLRNMVRNIVSFLVAIGKKTIPLKSTGKIIRKEIPYIKKPAPGCGLYLLKVRYHH